MHHNNFTKTKHFFLLLLVAISIKAFGQRNEISVNHFTGTPIVSIPLYTITSGDAVLPVGINYSTNGVKPTDLDGPMGLTWQLSAGGEIVRELRGVPDDCQKDNATTPNARLGWLYSNNGSAINNFTIANDNSTATCSDESADIAYIDNNFAGFSDTEPDLFYVNAPGLSCKLVFDNNKNIRTIPYLDVIVTYTTDATGLINSFTIVNDKGITFTFSDAESATTKSGSSTPSSITYLKREYDAFVNGITYNTAWKLTSIRDTKGNSIVLTYDYGGELPGANTTRISEQVNTYSGTTGGSSIENKQYSIITTYVPKRIFDVRCSDGITTKQQLLFTFKDFSAEVLSVADRAYTPILTSIAGLGKTLYFNYTNISGYRRFLNSINSSTQKDGDPFTYKFDYSSFSLPDSSSKHLDIWGYYNANGASSLNPKIYINPNNPSFERYRAIYPVNNTGIYTQVLNGADRSANPAVVDYGSLTKVTFPDGGSATFSYESNEFYDNTAAAVIKGGGIRIKQITYADNLNATNNISTNFTYINPLTSISSGKPISIPVLAYTIPYAGTGTNDDLWNFSTVRSGTNFSPEDNTIVYSYVKEIHSGAGSTIYEFTVPATAWDLSSSPDWNATTSHFARAGCAASGFMQKDVNTYPFAPNANFEFERGLIKSVTHYNEVGKVVSSIVYTYQRSGSPIVIKGLRFGENGSVKSYAVYPLFTSTSELISKEENIIYDSATLTQEQRTTNNYYYTSSVHKLLTQQQTVNSDGTIQNNFIKYLKDYNASTGSDPNVVAMRNLQQMNVNVPVEKYFQVVRNGSTKTIGGDLTKFNTFNAQGVRTLYVPSQSLNLVSGDGISNFQPSTVTGGIFSNDPNYVVVGNMLAYDFSGFPLSIDDNNKNISSVLTDHSNYQPVATISNARYDEIAYNDFNSTIKDVGFVRQSGSNTYSANSRSGKYALSLEANMPMTKVLAKNTLAKSYIFSIWVNTNTAGNITVSLTNTNGQTYNYLLPISSAGVWKYYELKIPVTSMTVGFTAQFQSSVAILIDDILFYPETAEVSTIAYDPVTNLKTAQTNTNGVSTYYSYDNFGRLRFVYDQDKQITLKNTYGIADSSGFKTPWFDNLIQVTKEIPVIFTASTYTSPYSEGLTYSWNYGDGSAPVTTSALNAPPHTYNASGTYTVTLTANSPIYGTKSFAGIVTVREPAAQTMPVSYRNNTVGAKLALSRVEFYEGDTLKYNFTDAQLAGGQTILRGNYTVKIYFNKVIGFKTISVNASTGTWCFPTSGTATSPNTLMLNLTNSTYLEFSSEATDCLL